jgi:molecular chaperone DnaK (HSP70)
MYILNTRWISIYFLKLHIPLKYMKNFTSYILLIIIKGSRQCGGRDMDRVLVDKFSEEFKKKFGCDPRTNKKAMLKLEDAVTKCKKILSANDQGNVDIECLMEDEDLRGKCSREEFEELCKLNKYEGINIMIGSHAKT